MITIDTFLISEFEESLKFGSISDDDGNGELLINNTEQKYYGSPCVILLDKAKLHESWGDTVVILWYNK